MSYGEEYARIEERITRGESGTETFKVGNPESLDACIRRRAKTHWLRHGSVKHIRVSHDESRVYVNVQFVSLNAPMGAVANGEPPTNEAPSAT